MTDRFLVEVIRADEVREADEVVIVEFRGKVAETKAMTRFDLPRFRNAIWVALESHEGAELSNDSQVLRVVPAEPTPVVMQDGRSGAEKWAGETVNIAYCPEHGLHGARDTCFECGKPVEQIPMRVVPAEAEPTRPAEPTDAQVEAAAKAAWDYIDRQTYGVQPAIGRMRWDELPELGRADQRALATEMLNAARKAL